DGPPNERKIVKLCEYAAKNPFRIPKIAKYLEDRCYKELRLEHIKFINIVAEAYNKLLCLCKEQITTMRRVLDPMFVYFDSGHHWVPCQGLAMLVLSDMSYFMEASVASALASQIRSGAVLAEIGFVSDLCRHLRKSLQATAESVGEQESNINIMLQNSIEDCLLEIARGIGNVGPLFDMMALTLEKLPSGVAARATIASLMIVAHMTSLALSSSRLQQVIESLLVQLLKVMVHPDVEVRVGGTPAIFSPLIPNSKRSPT
ncbi:hypothetical protein GBA52_018226, partial [Prunus armeniaca]